MGLHFNDYSTFMDVKYVCALARVALFDRTVCVMLIEVINYQPLIGTLGKDMIHI